MSTPRKLAPAWITTPELQRLFAALGAPSVDVRCVGGCVRDAAMGLERPRAEIDIGTPEPPEQVIKRLTDARIKVVPTGLDHGTVTAVVDGRPFEITSLRRDTACDGRHAAVEFTTDWHEDARRRDFTFNAMSMALDGVVHDDHNGLADAAAGRVRFVGDAEDRIQEDYLRILRLFRFAALYGRAPIDAATLAACGRHKDGLARLSAERVHDEMAKLLAAADPVPALLQMQSAGVLDAILPEHHSGDILARLIALERDVPTECGVDISDRVWVRRLGALIPAAAREAVATRLKLSNDEVTRLERAVSGPAITPLSTERDVHRALFHDGADAVMDRMLVARAAPPVLENKVPEIQEWQALVARVCAWTPRPLPINGGDVMAQGIAAGPEVGRILAVMTEWWIDAAFKPSRAEALKQLARLFRKG